MIRRVTFPVIVGIVMLVQGFVAVAQSIPEVEPNDTPAQCQMLSSLPAVITGEVNGSYDYFCFTLSGGEFLGFDIDAKDLGSPLNSYLRLYDTDGITLLAENDNAYDPDFHRKSLDSYLIYSFSGSGTYYLKVSSAPDGTGGAGQWYELYLEAVNPYDPDADLLPNWEESNTYGTDPFNPDTDEDGLIDGNEANLFFTNPLDPDMDDDEMLDGWEFTYSVCVNLWVPDASADPDNDTLNNLTEHSFGTNPCSSDTDSDDLPDLWEITYAGCGFDPSFWDSECDTEKFGSDVRMTNAAGDRGYPSLVWTGSEFGVSWQDSRDEDYEIYFARISASG